MILMIYSRLLKIIVSKKNGLADSAKADIPPFTHDTHDFFGKLLENGFYPQNGGLDYSKSPESYLRS